MVICLSASGVFFRLQIIRLGTSPIKASSKAGTSFLSKWLERSPPTSYPRSWRGKLARIKTVDGLRPNPYRGSARALAKRLFHKPRPHPEEQAKPASRRMHRARPPRRPRPSRRPFRPPEGEGLGSVQAFEIGSKPGVIVNCFSLEMRT